MAVVAGQILSSCIPYVDIRDVAGNEVEVTYAKMSDGSIRISDAWINQ